MLLLQHIAFDAAFVRNPVCDTYWEQSLIACFVALTATDTVHENNRN